MNQAGWKKAITISGLISSVMGKSKSNGLLTFSSKAEQNSAEKQHPIQAPSATKADDLGGCTSPGVCCTVTDSQQTELTHICSRVNRNILCLAVEDNFNASADDTACQCCTHARRHAGIKVNYC